MAEQDWESSWQNEPDWESTWGAGEQNSDYTEYDYPAPKGDSPNLTEMANHPQSYYDSSNSSFAEYSPYGEEPTAAYSAGPKATTSARTSAASSAAATKPQIIQTGSTGVSTTTKTPTGVAPQLADLGTFDAPEWDEREVSRMTQSKAAPGVRKLRSAVQRAMSTPYENPNVRAMTLREALGGFGLGLQGVMTGAESAAQAEYGRKYQNQYQAKAMQYQTDVQAKMTQFQADFQNYLSQYTTETTQTTTPSYTTADKIRESVASNSGNISRAQVVTFGTGY